MLALLRGAMFFKLRATAGTTIGGVGEGDGERRGEDGERSWWGDGVLDDAGGCRGRGVKRDLQGENKKCFYVGFELDLSYSLLEGLWYSDKETEDGCWLLGGCGEGEESVESSGEGASFGERDW